MLNCWTTRSSPHFSTMAKTTNKLMAATLEKPAVLVSEMELTPSDAPEPPRYLVASPYTDAEHLLDLQSLDIENQLLSEALQSMRAVTEEYSTRPYVDSFNWDEVVRRLGDLASNKQHRFKETSWYIVAFRSQIKSTAVYPDLGALDKAAHAEAMASGGFLKYAPQPTAPRPPILMLLTSRDGGATLSS